MKDIDFDELDRAVSSLMGSVPKDSPVPKDDEVPRTTETVAVSETATVQAESIAPESTSSVTEPEPVFTGFDTRWKREDGEEGESDDTARKTPDNSPISSPAPSRGRFMDMVRPSSRDATKTLPTAPPSRLGVTLQPRSSQPVAATESIDQKQQPKEEPNPAEEITAEVPDFSKLTLDTGEPMEDTTTFASTSEDTQSTVSGYAVPLSSPFLADAKVEKRPLGRTADTAAYEEQSDSQESGSETKPDISVAAEESATHDKDAQLPEQPLPAELDSELLSIETSNVEAFQESQTTEPMSMLSMEADEAAVKPKAAAPSVPSASESTSSSPDPIRTIASTSIPQQYKVQAGVNEETPVGAIYDTQPLMHPAEKKPGWLLVVAILAILVLGAAGGAAVYYLGLL